MKKKKLYILITVIVAVILVAILVTILIFFSMCQRQTPGEQEIGIEDTELKKEDEIVEDVKKEPAEDTTQEPEEEPATEASEEEGSEEQAEQTQQQQAEAPTLTLEIYEGPLYSQADDVCYWRVKAIVTGVPAPTVEFSRDDSNSAWGSRKAQVNIEDPSDSYTLIATATNPGGTATDSIVLIWECNRDPEISDIVMMGDHFVGVEYTVSAFASDPDGDSLSYRWSVSGGSLNTTSSNPIKWTMPSAEGDYTITIEVDDGKGGTASMTETVEVLAMLGPPIAAMEVPIVVLEGGKITSDENVWVGNSYMVGDTSTNLAIRGYVSFDITGLSGATVESAQLDVNHSAILNNCDLFKPLWVTSVNWEPGHIMAGDFNLSGDPIASFHSPDFSTNTDKLRIYLQNAIDSGRDRFQLMFLFTGMLSDGDNTSDVWGYMDFGIKLNITYYP